MKGKLIKTVTTLTWLSNIGIVVGIISTYIKARDWHDAWIARMYQEGLYFVIEEVESYKDCFFDKYNVAVWAMGIGVVVSLITLSVFRTSGNCIPSIMLSLEAFLGLAVNCYIQREYTDTVVGFGDTLTRVSYVFLLLAGAIALGIDIYNACIKDSARSRRESEGSDHDACPKCGKKISEEKYCDNCGFSLLSLNCPSCGTRRSGTSVFCKECGVRLPELK